MAPMTCFHPKASKLWKEGVLMCNSLYQNSQMNCCRPAHTQTHTGDNIHCLSNWMNEWMTFVNLWGLVQGDQLVVSSFAQNRLPAVSCKSMQQPFTLKREHLTTESGCTCLYFRLHHLLVISQQVCTHENECKQGSVDRNHQWNHRSTTQLLRLAVMIFWMGL